MREYTAKEIRLLAANPYTFKVTKHKLYFSAEFKQEFWIGYQAGVTPRKLLSDMGYDLDLFEQKQIDSLTQRIKRQGERGENFSEGEARSVRAGYRKFITNKNGVDEIEYGNPQVIARLVAEVQYLRQEVEFLKKIAKSTNARKR